MCTTELFTDIKANGEQSTWSRTKLCKKSRNGRVCENEVQFQHPAAYAGTAPPIVTYTGARPPTPRHTPNSSTSSIPLASSYHSGNESDRSPKRSSGVYVNGKKVLDLNKRRDRERAPERHHHRDRGAERIIIVDHPPTPRTPPTPYALPYTAPPSPIAGGAYVNVVDATRGPRPIIVDERTSRPRVEVETVTLAPQPRVVSLNIPSGSHGHRRSTSNGSNTSSNAVSGDELRRQQRREERDRAAAERELREQRLRREIRLQNESIAARPAVPMPPTPPPSTPYLRRTATAAATHQQERDLREAMRQLDVGDRREEEARRMRAQARAELEAREEARDQERRLRERMMPRRRATVGPGGRRHRIVYDDGIYRWE